MQQPSIHVEEADKIVDEVVKVDKDVGKVVQEDRVVEPLKTRLSVTRNAPRVVEEVADSDVLIQPTATISQRDIRSSEKRCAGEGQRTALVCVWSYVYMIY